MAGSKAMPASQQISIKSEREGETERERKNVIGTLKRELPRRYRISNELIIRAVIGSDC